MVSFPKIPGDIFAPEVAFQQREGGIPAPLRHVSCSHGDTIGAGIPVVSFPKSLGTSSPQRLRPSRERAAFQPPCGTYHSLICLCFSSSHISDSPRTLDQPIAPQSCLHNPTLPSATSVYYQYVADLRPPALPRSACVGSSKMASLGYAITLRFSPWTQQHVVGAIDNKLSSVSLGYSMLPPPWGFMLELSGLQYSS